MARHRLIWQIFPAFFLVIALTLTGAALVTWLIPGLYLRVAAYVFVVLAVAGFLSWRLAHRIVQPIEQMKQAAVRFAAGQELTPIPLPDSIEMAELAEALNQVAGQRDERVRLATEQRNERDAILASMMEGVIAVDTDQRIISMNHAAGELFDCTPREVQGKSIRHAVRNPRLVEMIAEAQLGPESISREMLLTVRGDEKVLQAHATPLRSARDEVMGVLVVLDDITGLRRLEQVRSDFVANVSHELKTPITSIKGFVETILESEPSPEEQRHFLEIVAKQADRLHAIIQDLLTLSRIEQEEEERDSILSAGTLLPVVQSAVQLCGAAAAAKELRVSVACPAYVRARINAPLLEQGLTNLIDNAIKYSERGAEVRVEVTEAQGEISIAVVDAGCGIAAQHLPRLFERFYRVDKARSRQLGGTGLGLAIVKHIAQTHGGRIEVESKPGAGSTFRITLPALDPTREELGMAV